MNITSLNLSNNYIATDEITSSELIKNYCSDLHYNFISLIMISFIFLILEFIFITVCYFTKNEICSYILKRITGIKNILFNVTIFVYAVMYLSTVSSYDYTKIILTTFIVIMLLPISYKLYKWILTNKHKFETFK